MHAESIMRKFRILTFIIPALALAGCGQGDGPESIPGTAATPLPPIPPGFCDAINFEVLCPPAVITPFASAVTEIIDNPDMSGINNSDKVLQFQKFPNPPGDFFGGVRFDLPEAVDFAAGQAFKVKIWSPRGVPLTFKLEESNDGTGGVEKVRGHSGSGMWEELCYDFPGETRTVIAYSLIFDNGVEGFADVDPDNWTFFIDDIEQTDSCPAGAPTMLPVDFENAAFDYEFRDGGGFEGGQSAVIPNPDPSGINTSAQVARMQKFPPDSGNTFGGSTLSLDVTADIVSGSSFTMKVWSQRQVPVLLEPQPQGTGSGAEVLHTGTGWEELTFVLPLSTTGTVDGITVIFDVSVIGDAINNPTDWTFYYDDITLVPPGGGGGPTAFSALTFDDPAVAYALRGFGGAEDSTVVVDPTDSGNTVVQVNRADTAETFAGTVVSTMANEAVGVIPLDAMNTEMSVRVWSPAAGIPVRLKIENSNDAGVSVETEATTTVAMAWETLTFNFANEVAGTAAFDPAATYDKVIIFFNFGTDGATAGAQTFYFDDIDVGTGGGGPGPAMFSTLTFDDPAVTYVLRGFGGAEDSSVVVDPTDAGNMVVQVNRSAAAETFAGTVVSTMANEAVGVIPLDAMNTQMNLRVWSPAAGIPVRLKIENSLDAGVSVETEATTTVAMAWETLTFDFANEAAGTAAFNPAATYDKVVIFFNFGIDGATAGAQTFYFDDVAVGAGGGGGGPTAFSALTFDDPAVAYALRGFGGAEDSSVVVDPTDAGNMVVQVNRSAAAETFAGTVVSTMANEAVGVIPLDAMNTQMNLRVWSPAAGIPVRLKIENSLDAGVSVETEATTTVAMAWETLTFDFANEAAGTAAFNPAATYDKVVIFFNFGTDGATAGAQTFYFDDIDVGAGPGGGGGGGGFNAVTFDDGAVTYTLRGFGGAEDSSVVVDPTDAGNMVVQVNRSATAETFAGTVVSTGPNESIDVIPLDAMNTQMNVRVWSPAAGIPVRLKIENSLDAGVSVETEATTTVAMAWETLTFDFANEAAGTAAFNPAATYDKVVIFFNFGTDGATAGAQTFYFDDIDVGAGPGGGGGGGGFNAVTFDDGAVTYTLRGFGGAEDSSVVVDPTDAGNMVVQVNRSATAETFAGTVVSTGPNESIDVIPLDAMNTQMNVRVWSPAIGVPVRLKIENSLDAGVSVETEATTTASGVWETLTFDFANEAAGTAAFNPAATYDKVVIFFNFGTDGATAGAQTFYFDDIDVGPGMGGGGGGAFSSLSFDDPAVTVTLRGFGGAEDSSVVVDPTDAGNMVVQVVRSATAETFAGTVVSTGPNESVPVIPLDAMNTQMSVRVWSPAAGIVVRMKIENSLDAGVSVETEATTTVAMAWETLTFNFLNEVPGTAAFDPAATYDKIVIFFNFGVDGATAGEQTFYFDDITFVPGTGGGGGGGGFNAVTFDDMMLTYALRGFGGAEDSSVVADPTDPTNNVVQVNRSATAETFAGTVVSTGPNESIDVIPLDAMNTMMNVRVWSPAAGVPVRLKIENSLDAGVSVETEATTTVAMAWETLTFDFSNEAAGTAAFNPASTYDKVVIFFNFGTDGATAGAQTFYFDDIDVGAGPGGGGGPTFNAVTFDDMMLTYALRGFGGAEDSSVVADPTDPTNNVVQVNRSATAETFAGTVVSTGANESIDVIPLDAMNTMMNVRVWSPAAGIVVRLKIENSLDAGVSVETEATTTVAMGWETLTFDFSNEAAGTAAFNPASTYDKVVIFFNFGTNGATAGAQTFYFDDIDVGAGAGGGGGGGSGLYAAIDFDDMMLTYTLRGFGGAEDSTVVADPTDPTNNVVQVNRSATAETFAGSVVSTGANESVPVLPLDAMNTQMTVRVYSAAAGVQVRLKVENSTDAGVSVETEATTTTSGAWETLTFNFLNEATGTAAFNPASTYDKVVVFFNFGVNGATAGAQTYFFDDIDVVDP